MEDFKYKWNIIFQKCDKNGCYWENDGWKDVTVYANTESEAIKKAKAITEVDYYRSLKIKVIEEI